jgi:pyridoxal phosphate enzyme (YggS family)
MRLHPAVERGLISLEQLAENFAAIERRLAAACARAGRPREAVKLVAVSKRHPPEVIRLAWQLGHRDFGENYAQELRDKHVALADCAGLRWHAIGPVQTKNAKYIAKAAHLFHALERLEVASELSKRRTGSALPCLLEVNVALEASKAGVAPADVAALLAATRALPNLEIVGLTTMPPLDDDAEAARPHFRAVAALAKALQLPELSMGTTADFEVAVEEGATLVRVGTALFGERS